MLNPTKNVSTKICDLILILIAIALSFCSEVKTKQVAAKETSALDQSLIIKNELQPILDAAKVSGSILIYDAQKEVYYSNDFGWANAGRLPASTFKIPNSIIALETEIIENDSTLLKWDGIERGIKNWNQDLIFRDAFHFSCVPCYQDIARGIGDKRMNEYLNRFEYGSMKVDSSNIDVFWLEGDSRISQFQQIDFLKRFNNSKFFISERTKQLMKSLMIIEHNENYKLSGKTGWSIRNGNNNGWFVGYIETKNQVYYFATNIDPKVQFDMQMFAMIRKEITMRALKEIGMIE
ncbi:MAG: class D beta-lactamase [Aurantibacter sp.]